MEVSIMASILQKMHYNNGGYDKCFLCKQPAEISETRYFTIYGKSQKHEIHLDCLHRYNRIDNTAVFNSSAVRKNGIINRIVISVNGDDMDAIKAYFISAGYTYCRSNQYGCMLLSPKFSGCSSISALLRNSLKKVNYQLKKLTVVNLNDGTSKAITMKSGLNTDYTECIRLFNDKKENKLNEYIKAHN
jgi:hypothetical protein